MSLRQLVRLAQKTVVHVCDLVVLHVIKFPSNTYSEIPTYYTTRHTHTCIIIRAPSHKFIPKVIETWHV